MTEKMTGIPPRGLSGYLIDSETDMFGYWICTICGSSFYDGPRAVHNLSCKDSRMPKEYYDETYKNCIRVRNKAPTEACKKKAIPEEWVDKCNNFEYFKVQ